MTYGRILLIAALVFGAIYYYQSSQAEQEYQAFHHQLRVQEDAARLREAEWEREKDERATRRPAASIASMLERHQL